MLSTAATQAAVARFSGAISRQVTVCTQRLAGEYKPFFKTSFYQMTPVVIILLLILRSRGPKR